ncbi:MAG: hypothetical protein IT371_07045 [Deltaproteobacteria bacterium]|nr:hypothetical protein [Deltaproteobacteria bacterium]
MGDTLRQTETIALMREVLRESYTNLQVRRVDIKEQLDEETTEINCEVINEATGEKSVIAGKGVGVIDAFFQGVADRFATEYPSLRTIRFAAFTVQAQLGSKRGYAGTDSKAEVTVEVANSDDKRFRFTHASRSVIASSIVTTLAALEYFINSERAFVTMYHALKDAKERNRSDLVQRYTNALASLVQNTSYSEVISKIRTDLGPA